jgi:hypothetical protein
MNQKKKQSYRLGIIVLMILAVLTVIEFSVAAVNFNWSWLMFSIAILKAWFVIQHYMHLPRLFKEEETL